MSDFALAIIISLIGAAFISASGTAYALSNKLLFEIESKKKNIITRILSVFFDHPEQYNAFLLVAKVVIIGVYSIFSYKMLLPYTETYIDGLIPNLLVIIFIASITYLIIGEYIPKLITSLNPHLLLSLFAIPLYILYILLYPAAMISAGITQLIYKGMGAGSSAHNAKNSGLDDLDLFFQQTIEETNEKEELETEVRFIQNAIEFSQVKVRDCIVPRTEVIAVDKSVSSQELTAKFIETGLSKIVVYDDDIDNILGYIHSSELFNKPSDWTTRIITLPFVPDNMNASKLMKNMLAEKKGMAVAIDEFGGTSGIITLEDLVEEIFGEIEDEHDTNKEFFGKKTKDNQFILSGRAEIDKINEQYEIGIPESDEYLTIAGYILSYYQNFPKLNEVILIDHFEFKILKLTHTKIELVSLRVL